MSPFQDGIVLATYSLQLSMSIACIHSISLKPSALRLMPSYHVLFKVPLCLLSQGGDICHAYGLHDTLS